MIRIWKLWFWIFLLALIVGGSISASAQTPADAVDVVFLIDRSGRPPEPARLAMMRDLLILWASVASPRDRVGVLQVGATVRRLTPNLISMRGLEEERAMIRGVLQRPWTFDGREANWGAAIDQARSLLRGEGSASPYQGFLALARGDPTTPLGEQRLFQASTTLQGWSGRPFLGLSLEGRVDRMDAALGAVTGGWVQVAREDPWRDALAQAVALSPYRWVTWVTLQPGLENRIMLPPQTTWGAFVLIRPAPSARLASLFHNGTDWLGPAGASRVDRWSTDQLDGITLLESGDYGGEWRIRMEGPGEALLGVVIALREPLLPEAPGLGRRWLVPAGAPLYVEAMAPSAPAGMRFGFRIGESEIPLEDDGGPADPQAGDGRAAGLGMEMDSPGSLLGAFQMQWEGLTWEQPVWLDVRSDLPVLVAQVASSPTIGIPITVTVERPVGVEEVSWRWVGWQIAKGRWERPTPVAEDESGWMWTIQTSSSGAIRFLGLAEVRAAMGGVSQVYHQAVVADFKVTSPLEGRLAATLEGSPARLQLPGSITMIITSTLDRPAR
ncbi:MAG: vWA domain-containing protein, partial [Thermoflexus sp.]